MIEGKFYAKCLKESYANLEERGIPLGVGDKYLLRRLSQEYAYHCLREDFQQDSDVEAGWKKIISYGKRTRKDFIIADEGLNNAKRMFKEDYLNGFSIK